MSTFKAYRVFNDGGRVRGELTEISEEDLDVGEVLLHATFSSVNYKDALAATGADKVMRRFPITGEASTLPERSLAPPIRVFARATRCWSPVTA